MKVDFRFTPDGDLDIGSPKFNEEEELLYVGDDGEQTTDDSSGILVRDIPLQYSYLSEAQVVHNRLRTTNPEWAHYTTIGSDLSELIGLPNTRETGEYGRELIKQALCGDGFILESNLNIRAIPVGPNEILFKITITSKNISYSMPILYDLEHGILTDYEVEAE